MVPVKSDGFFPFTAIKNDVGGFDPHVRPYQHNISGKHKVPERKLDNLLKSQILTAKDKSSPFI